MVKAITIAGLTWPVRVRSGLKVAGEVVDGVCIPDKQEIRIHRGITTRVDRTRKTILHEAMHAALLSHPQYYDETLIAIIEDRVDELIRLNPALMEMYGYHA